MEKPAFKRPPPRDVPLFREEPKRVPMTSTTNEVGGSAPKDELFIPESKACPFCGEEVRIVAKICRHCGQTIDVTLRAAEEARRSAEEAKRAAEHALRAADARKPEAGSPPITPSPPLALQSPKPSPQRPKKRGFAVWHFLHLLITVVTLGNWLPMWVFHWLLWAICRRFPVRSYVVAPFAILVVCIYGAVCALVWMPKDELLSDPPTGDAFAATDDDQQPRQVSPGNTSPAPASESTLIVLDQQLSRTWKDSSGKFTTRARLFSFDQGTEKVTIIKDVDGKVVILPLAKLSEMDKIYVETAIE
jgi:hypothetical protein